MSKQRVFLYVGLVGFGWSLGTTSTTQPPRCDPRGCHESKNDPIAKPHASYTLGESPSCDGHREVWNIVVTIRPRAGGSYVGENENIISAEQLLRDRLRQIRCVGL